MKKPFLFLLFTLLSTTLMAQKAGHVVTDLKITILSTMLADRGIGEWGFSALIETGGQKILFDSGGRKTTVLDNARELHIDLSKVPVLVLSHSHDDHTTGWVSLRQKMGAINKSAFSVTHVAPGFFDTRVYGAGEDASRRADSAEYTRLGGNVITDAQFTEIAPGIYLTGGNIPRVYPEKNYQPAQKKDASGHMINDIVPEDMSMVIVTAKGWVLISGCGHAGMINTITAIQKHLPKQPLYAAIGGFHLLAATNKQIKWTAEQLKKDGLRYFMGAHCTGIEPVYEIREWAGLKRGESIVGSVGAVFELNAGFKAGALSMGNRSDHL